MNPIIQVGFLCFLLFLVFSRDWKIFTLIMEDFMARTILPSNRSPGTGLTLSLTTASIYGNMCGGTEALLQCGTQMGVNRKIYKKDCIIYKVLE